MVPKPLEGTAYWADGLEGNRKKLNEMALRTKNRADRAALLAIVQDIRASVAGLKGEVLLSFIKAKEERGKTRKMEAVIADQKLQLIKMKVELDTLKDTNADLRVANESLAESLNKANKR